MIHKKNKKEKETNINNFITVGLISVYTKNRLVFWHDDKELSLGVDAIDCETLSLSLSHSKKKKNNNNNFITNILSRRLGLFASTFGK